MYLWKEVQFLTFSKKGTPQWLSVQSVQLLSRVQLLATPWTAARQASLSITNGRSLPKPMSIESVMPSNQHNLCHPLLSYLEFGKKKKKKKKKTLFQLHRMH